MKMSKRKTGKFCVAANCTSTHADNVSLHEFPKDTRQEIRRKWITFVKVKRKNFTSTACSVLCEKHFAPDCYPLEYSIKKSMGIEVKRKNLLPDAIPTIHSVRCQDKSDRCQKSSKKCALKTKKMRTAFRKRECQRAIQTVTTATECSDVEMEHNLEDDIPLELSETADTTRSVGSQCGGLTVPRRYKRCQTTLKTMDKGFTLTPSLPKQPVVVHTKECRQRNTYMMHKSKKDKMPIYLGDVAADWHQLRITLDVTNVKLAKILLNCFSICKEVLRGTHTSNFSQLLVDNGWPQWLVNELVTSQADNHDGGENGNKKGSSCTQEMESVKIKEEPPDSVEEDSSSSVAAESRDAFDVVCDIKSEPMDVETQSSSDCFTPTTTQESLKGLTMLEEPLGQATKEKQQMSIASDQPVPVGLVSRCGTSFKVTPIQDQGQPESFLRNLTSLPTEASVTKGQAQPSSSSKELGEKMLVKEEPLGQATKEKQQMSIASDLPVPVGLVSRCGTSLKVTPIQHQYQQSLPMNLASLPNEAQMNIQSNTSSKKIGDKKGVNFPFSTSSEKKSDVKSLSVRCAQPQHSTNIHYVTTQSAPLLENKNTSTMISLLNSKPLMKNINSCTLGGQDKTTEPSNTVKCVASPSQDTSSNKSGKHVILIVPQSTAGIANNPPLVSQGPVAFGSYNASESYSEHVRSKEIIQNSNTVVSNNANVQFLQNASAPSTCTQNLNNVGSNVLNVSPINSTSLATITCRPVHVNPNPILQVPAGLSQGNSMNLPLVNIVNNQTSEIAPGCMTLGLPNKMINPLLNVQHLVYPLVNNQQVTSTTGLVTTTSSQSNNNLTVLGAIHGTNTLSSEVQIGGVKLKTVDSCHQEITADSNVEVFDNSKGQGKKTRKVLTKCPPKKSENRNNSENNTLDSGGENEDQEMEQENEKEEGQNVGKASKFQRTSRGRLVLMPNYGAMEKGSAMSDDESDLSDKSDYAGKDSDWELSLDEEILGKNNEQGESEEEMDEEEMNDEEIEKFEKEKKKPKSNRKVVVNLDDHQDKYEITKHISLHKSERNLTEEEKSYEQMTCKLCGGFSCILREAMEEHLGLHFSKKLNCSKCEKTFNTVYSRQKHVREEHSKGCNFICEICAESFSTKKQLASHMGKIHAKAAVDCYDKDCEEKFCSYKEMVAHAKADHENVIYTCPKCGKDLKYCEIVIKKHTDSQRCTQLLDPCSKITCKICGKSFSSQNMSKHIRSNHAKIITNKCPHCPFETSKGSRRLRLHIKTHTGEHDYRCDQCYFTCIYYSQLVSHKRTHTGEKPYKCDLCPYAAAWNVQLKDHMKAHESSAKVTCETCKIVLKDSRALKMHMKKQHS